MTSFRLLALNLIVFLLCNFALARSAFAQVDPFELEVFDYRTSGRGIPGVAWLNSYVPNGHSGEGEGTSSGTLASNLMYRTTLELSYGITDHLDASVDLNLAWPNAASLEYAGSKYRLKGNLFEQEQFGLFAGWFVELGWLRTPQFNENQLEVEIRPIIEKDFGQAQIVLNPKFEKGIFVGPNHNRGFEFGYAAGLYYRLTKDISPGLEFYGGIGHVNDTDPLRQQQHYVFPILRIEAVEGTELSVGPGFGLTSGSDRVLMKLNIEFDLSRH